MSSKVLGFLGVECYDLLLYTASVLHNLECRVLLIDQSTNQSLVSIVPGEPLTGDEIVEYRGVDFVARQSISDEYMQGYDYIFIYFGFDIKAADIFLCEEIYLVTDYQRHNLNRLAKVRIQDEQVRFLVIRDDTGSKLNRDFAVESLRKLNISDNNVISLAKLDQDYDTMLLCQYDSIITFRKVSSDIHHFIHFVLEIDFKGKEIKRALKLASKGVLR